MLGRYLDDSGVLYSKNKPQWLLIFKILREQPTDSSLITIAKSWGFKGSIHFTWRGMSVKSIANVDFEPLSMSELALAWSSGAFDISGGIYKSYTIKPISTGSTRINVQ